MAKKVLTVVLVLVLIIIVTGSIIALYMLTNFDFSDFEMDSETGSATIDAQGNEDVKKIVFNADLETADLDIELSKSGANHLFKADWAHSYLTDSKDLSKLKFTNSTSNGILTINIDIEHPEDYIWEFETWDVNIEINPDLDSYSLDMHISTGDLDIALNEITLNKFEVETTTGDIDISLIDSEINNNLIIDQTTGSLSLEALTSTIKGDIQATQTTGDKYIVLEDVVMSKDAKLSFDVTTGDTEIIWDQSFALTHDVEINSDCTTGDFIMTINSPSSITRYDIEGAVVTGDFNVNGISRITDNHYRSDNFDDLSKDLLKIMAAGTTGDIIIQVND